MEKISLLLIFGLAVTPAFARRKWPVESVALKARQQQELRAFKLKQKYVKSSLEQPGLPKAVRAQMKHELKREKRKLLRKQKDERQTLKDRQKLLKLEMKQLETE